jgi:hypothetical protein
MVDSAREDFGDRDADLLAKTAGVQDGSDIRVDVRRSDTSVPQDTQLLEYEYPIVARSCDWADRLFILKAGDGILGSSSTIQIPPQ